MKCRSLALPRDKRAWVPELLTAPLHEIAQHMVNALYPTKGYDITELARQREITKSLLDW